MHQIMVTGTLTKDPQEFQGQESGGVNFSVASHEGKDETCFFECVMYGKRAEFVSKYFKKGDGISLVGRIKQSDYKDKDGKNRRSERISVDRVGFMEGRKNAQGSAEQPMQGQPMQNQQNQPMQNQYQQGQMGQPMQGQVMQNPYQQNQQQNMQNQYQQNQYQQSQPMQNQYQQAPQQNMQSMPQQQNQQQSMQQLVQQAAQNIMQDPMMQGISQEDMMGLPFC